MGNLTTSEALSLRWAEVERDPALRDLPYKIELNRHGKIEMSPANNRHARLQGYIAGEFARQLGHGEVLTRIEGQLCVPGQLPLVDFQRAIAPDLALLFVAFVVNVEVALHAVEDRLGVAVTYPCLAVVGHFEDGGAIFLRERAGKARRRRTEERDHAFHRYHGFEYASGALEIAIVLASVSVVTRMKPLTIGAGVIGLLASLLSGAVALGMV